MAEAGENISVVVSLHLSNLFVLVQGYSPQSELDMMPVKGAGEKPDWEGEKLKPKQSIFNRRLHRCGAKVQQEEVCLQCSHPKNPTPFDNWLLTCKGGLLTECTVPKMTQGASMQQQYVRSSRQLSMASTLQYLRTVRPAVARHSPCMGRGRRTGWYLTLKQYL